jgi:nucleoid-associated protein YgaU
MASQVAVATRTRHRGSPIAYLVDDQGDAYCLHNTPEQVTVAGVGNDYSTVSRQGRKPLVRFNEGKVRTMSFTHTITTANGAGAPRGPVVALMGVAELPRRFRLINVSAGIETRGWWFITELSVTVTERNPAQQPNVVTLSWSLTEANDARPKIGRVPPPPPKPPPPAVASRPVARTQPDYTVRRGDSLWAIASRLLGSGPRWREIYNLNQKRLNLTAPVMYRGLLTVWIYPGQRLKIPAR